MVSSRPLPPDRNAGCGPSDPRLTGSVRLLLVGLGVGLLGLLGVAASLRPASAGLGTHQQLGLPPCTVRWLYGVRCPSCGMTTAWAHLMRGQLRQALAANLGGTILGGVAILAAPWLLARGVRGTWGARVPKLSTLAWCCLAIVIVTLLDWFVRLARP